MARDSYRIGISSVSCVLYHRDKICISSVPVSHQNLYLIDITSAAVCHITLSDVFESTETSIIPDYQRLNISA